MSSVLSDINHALHVLPGLYLFFLLTHHIVQSIPEMPLVNNVEDAKVEISALQKEKSLLIRLSDAISSEIVRLRQQGVPVSTLATAKRLREN